MKKVLFLLLLVSSQTTFAQRNVDYLQFGKKKIPIPEGCASKILTNITDCNGFSVFWIDISNFDGNIQKKAIKDIEKQIKFASKKPIKFTSQGQPFEGNFYKWDDGTNQIVGFGEIDDTKHMLILQFKRDVKTNEDLTDFEKIFISLD